MGEGGHQGWWRVRRWRKGGKNRQDCLRYKISALTVFAQVTSERVCFAAGLLRARVRAPMKGFIIRFPSCLGRGLGFAVVRIGSLPKMC